MGLGRSTPARRAVLGVVAACVLAWALPALLLDGPARHVATTSALVAASALGAAVCAVRARAGRSSTRLHRWAWTCLAASCATWAAGEVLWSSAGLRTGSTAVPAAADLLFLGSAALLVAGVAAVALRSAVPAGRLLVALDCAVVAAAVLAATWSWLVEPFAPSDPTVAGAPRALASVLYVVLDVSAVAVGALLLARAARGHGATRWVGAVPLLAVAALGTAAGDFLTGQAALHGTYAFGHPAEAPYAVRTALVVAAALVAGREGEPRAALPRRWVLLAPPAIALAGTAVVLHRAVVGDVGGAHLAVVGVLALLVVGRQVLTVLEHTALRRDLEQRVRDRTGELARREEWLSTVLAHSSDAVLAVDGDGTVTWQSGGARHLGLPTAVGRPLVSALPRPAATRVALALAEVAAAPGSTRTVAWTLPGGDGERHLETVLVPLLDDPVVGAVVLATRDVTERTRLEQELVHRAFHDELTGLANRNLFRDRLEHALAARGRDGLAVAVLFLDLDAFKTVNDTLGHAAGDALLQAVGERLRAVVRPGDTVARLGGDEFAVLLERVSTATEAEVVAARVLDGLADPVVLAGRPLAVSGSVGLAVSETGTETGEDLLQGADLAMYHAKARRSREPVRFQPRMHAELLARVRTEEGLRGALQRDELLLHYQPTVDLATGRVQGVEALVRWQHPDGRLVPPLEFIDIAEECGLIAPLGEWVLRRACAQAARWARRAADEGAGGPVSVSVNVSGRQLAPALVPTVARVLAETGLPPHLLVLELTESVLVTDGEGTLALLRALKDLGVRLAIDDFGTGYSSLAYLSRLPVDVLKVDRSFVAGLAAGPDAQPEDAVVARTIVELARTLGLATTAEGVETPEQLEALQHLGADTGQGWIFSRPVPAEDVEALLAGPVTGWVAPRAPSPA